MAEQGAQAVKQLVDKAPGVLVHLVRKVVRAFYTAEHAIVIDYLCKHSIIKEEELAKILKLDTRQVRQLLMVLKQDLLVCVHRRPETSETGQVNRFDWYYINYQLFVNVVKYKLDSMQRKLELEQREFTSRAAFHCNSCSQTFTDLEVNMLVDRETGELKCSFCGAEVVEEENTATRQDMRLAMAKFHEQVRDPLDKLLREIEQYTLGPVLVNPTLRLGASSAAAGNGGRRDSSGQEPTDITISVTDTVDNGETRKEVPAWIADSTIDESSNFSVDFSGDNASTNEGPTKEEIADLLIQNEVATRQQVPPRAASSRATPTERLQQQQRLRLRQQPPSSDDDNSTSSTSVSNDGPASKRAKRPFNDEEEDDDDMDDDDEDDEESDEDDEEPTVAVQGKRVPYQEVTPEMVQQMTSEEKEEYREVGQRLHAGFDD